MDAKYGPSVVLPISIEHGGTGKTNIAEARSALKTVTSDSSAIKEPIVNIGTDNSMFVRWKTEDGNIYQIKGDINQGMRYEKKINGTWTTIPVDVTRGGTGGLNASEARTNLQLSDAFQFKDVSIPITTAAATTDSNLKATAPSISGYTPAFIGRYNISGTASSMLLITKMHVDRSTRVVSLQVRNTHTTTNANATATITIVYVRNTLL